MSDVLQDIAATPAWFPHMMDASADLVELLRRSEGDYRAASFLDDRSIQPGSERRIVAWSDLAAAIPAEARRDAHYIFHIGNVGSTLISRLLGELPGALALREPLLLRTFAERLASWPDAEARLDRLTALLSRTFRPEQRVIVKATSFTSEIAHRVVPTGSRALFLFAAPERYLESILAGPNSPQTLDILSPVRVARLSARCPGFAMDLPHASKAVKAALGWACEMTSLEANAAKLPSGSVLWMDFDLFLADPARHFADIAAFFGQPVDALAAGAICGGSLMRRYSKALEYEYSPAMRHEILAEARSRHGAAIQEALDWLGRLGSRYPAVATAIRRVQRGA
jgi:hypothetical protein